MSRSTSSDRTWKTKWAHGLPLRERETLTAPATPPFASLVGTLGRQAIAMVRSAKSNSLSACMNLRGSDKKRNQQRSQFSFPFSPLLCWWRSLQCLSLHLLFGRLTRGPGQALACDQRQERETQSSSSILCRQVVRRRRRQHQETIHLVQKGSHRPSLSHRPRTMG